MHLTDVKHRKLQKNKDMENQLIYKYCQSYIKKIPDAENVTNFFLS